MIRLSSFTFAAILFAASALLCTAGTGARLSKHTSDSLETVKERIADDEALLVDVREQSEWDAGHIAGAVLVPTSELSDGIDAEELEERLPEDKIIYTHCRSGRRSVTAGKLLSEFGYEVRPLKAGYQQLLDAGFEKATD